MTPESQCVNASPAPGTMFKGLKDIETTVSEWNVYSVTLM